MKKSTAAPAATIDEIDEERAANAAYFEKILNLRYLAGYYGAAAKNSGNAELAALVRTMTEALDGTWQRPEVLR